MKAIKLENAAEIYDALAAVNGRSFKHAYTGLTELQAVTDAAEQRLEAIGIPPSLRAGATVTSTSGSAVPNAYRYLREGTKVVLTRKAAGWYLTAAESVKIFSQGGGKDRLTLTKKQSDKAHANLAATFYVKAAQ